MILDVFGRVFRNARYAQLAIVVAFIVLSAALLLPNTNLIAQIYNSDSLSVVGKMSFILDIYGSIFTNFTTLSAFTTITTSVLFGINISLLLYYIRRRQSAATGRSAEWSSLGGIISGVFGVGCAACGSVVLSTLLTTFGAGGLIALLPFHGAEFGILGLLLLSASIWYLTKRINDPLICPIS